MACYPEQGVKRRLGKYTLLATLGNGGMADVYLALVGGPVAGFAKLAVVKQIRQHLAEDHEFIAMLREEARLSARLNHPNVVQVHDVGVDDGHHYLAMEYLDGQPLHRLLHRAQKARPRLRKDAIYLVISDALKGLHYAHELTDFDGTPFAIVHRDVNPQNVFVTYDGQVKLVDFGIAKANGRATETRQGFVRGKIRYMSPEQARGTAMDRRTDIFAAGIMLWQAAVGKRFWGSMTDDAIMQSLITGSYEPSPRAVDESVPEAIDAICKKALVPNPDDRYATAADMRADLEAFLGDREVEARRELVSAIGTLFAKERAELRAIVESSAASASMATSTGAMLVATAPEAREAVETTRPLEAFAPQPAAEIGPPKPRRFRLGGLVAAAALVVTLAVISFDPGLVVGRGTTTKLAPAVAVEERCSFASTTETTSLAPKPVEPPPARVETPPRKPPPRVRARPPLVRRWTAPPRPAKDSKEKPVRPKDGSLEIDTTDPWR